MSLHVWGFSIGPLHVCWWDLQERRAMFGIYWYRGDGRVYQNPSKEGQE